MFLSNMFVSDRGVLCMYLFILAKFNVITSGIEFLERV